MLNLKEDSKDLKRWKSEIRFVNVLCEDCPITVEWGILGSDLNLKRFHGFHGNQIY